MGAIAAVAAAGIWAISAALMGSQASRVDALSISVIRAVWAALFFVVLVFATGNYTEIGEMDAWTIAELIGSAVIGLALGDTLYVVSISLLGMNRAFTISIGLFAVFSFGLSAAVLGESIGVATIIGAGLVLAGVGLVASYGRDTTAAVEVEEPSMEATREPGAPPPIAGGSGEVKLDARTTVRLPWVGVVPRFRVGVVVVALAAVFWAIATVSLRDAAEGFGAISVGALRIPAAAGFLSAVALTQSRTSLRKRSVSRRSWGVLTVAGIVGTGVGSLLFIYAVQEAGAGKTAVLSSVSPLFALPLAAIFLGERITRWLVLGTGLAVIGIVLLA